MTIPFFPHRGIVLGTTSPHLTGFTDVRLQPPAEGHHTVVWGTSGSGKSRLLHSVVQQYIAKGHHHGTFLFDPHHDLAFALICDLVRKGFYRRKDIDPYVLVVYLDWTAGVVPYNVLAGDANPEDKALNVYEAMKRVWPSLEETPLFRPASLSP